MQTNNTIIDKNWKALIKPNKLEITSSDDKTIAKVVAEPLEKGYKNRLKMLKMICVGCHNPSRPPAKASQKVCDYHQYRVLRTLGNEIRKRLGCF